MDEPGGLAWWASHVPTSDEQRTLTIHDFAEILASHPRRSPNVIHASEATIHAFLRQLRILKRQQKRKATMKRRRAIGRARW